MTVMSRSEFQLGMALPLIEVSNQPMQLRGAPTWRPPWPPMIATPFGSATIAPITGFRYLDGSYKEL